MRGILSLPAGFQTSLSETCPIVADIEDALRFVERNTRLAYRIERLQREDIPEFPMKALREAITNAVMHRDRFIEGANVFVEIYDDRIEVVSPGGLPKGMTLADLGRKSVRRNALIADLPHRIGFVEKAGTGIKRIRDEARDGGYPEPVWEANGFVTTIFRPSAEVRAMAEVQAAGKHPASTPQVTRQGAAHVAHMHRTSPGHVAVLEASRDPRSREELQKVAGIRHRQHFLLEYLRPLLDAGLIELTIPDKPRSSKQRYRLTAAGIAYLSGLEKKKLTKKGRGK